MKTAKSSKRTGLYRDAAAANSPLRIGLNAMWEEVKATADRLGFDTSKSGWAKLVTQESTSYPCTLEGDDWETLQLLPRRSRARIRALELVETIVELLTNLETEVGNGDKWLAEMRRVLATDPVAMPLVTYN